MKMFGKNNNFYIEYLFEKIVKSQKLIQLVSPCNFLIMS